jgi:hypothetical protein
MFLSLMLAAAAVAAPAPQDGQPPQRIRNIQLQPGEQCPASTPNEIVVCGAADTEQYRIPKALREAPKTDAPSTSHAVKMDRVMQENRRVLPGSCSAIGTAGQTGCAQRAAEAWSAEMRARRNGQPVTPND